jgi:hypothetical protein
MSDYTKEIDEQKMVTADKVFMGVLFGIVAILSIWFLSGLLYVIFKWWAQFRTTFYILDEDGDEATCIANSCRWNKKKLNCN